jgi:hypothetical protein
MKKILTVNLIGHGLMPGDIVDFQTGRLNKLKKLFTRPRINYVGEVSHSTIQIIERRMTWKEWFIAFLNVASA